MATAVSNSSSNPLGQIFLDVGNHDQCDACGEGGDLLCCDNCPRSFHFECVNPPLDGKDVELMKEDWYCPSCSSTKKQKNGNSSKKEAEFVMEPMFTRLKESNPFVFSLPAEIKQGLDEFVKNEGDSKEKIDLDSFDARYKRKTKINNRSDDICSICGLSGETMCCRACNQSYHAYCLDPPILFENSSVPWYCPNHAFREHIVPDQTFKLSFLDPISNDNNDVLNLECSKLLLNFCQSVERIEENNSEQQRSTKRKASSEKNSTATKKPKKTVESTPRDNTKEPKEAKEAKEMRELPKEDVLKEAPKRMRKTEKLATITNGSGRILYTMSKPHILIGRSKSDNCNVDFAMSDIEGVKVNAVSRVHAEITMNKDGKSKTFTLESHGRNGTRVDGNLIGPNQTATLNDKSTLEINKFTMVFNIK